MKNGTRARIVEIEGAKRRVQVQAEDGEVAWVTDYVQDVEIPCDGRRGQYLRISQLPLTLAFALTIHKSQGQTLSAAVVSLAETTENPGQAYVACSRVRSSDNLYVVNYVSLFSFPCICRTNSCRLIFVFVVGLPVIDFW